MGAKAGRPFVAPAAQNAAQAADRLGRKGRVAEGCMALSCEHAVGIISLGHGVERGPGSARGAKGCQAFQESAPKTGRAACVRKE